MLQLFCFSDCKPNTEILSVISYATLTQKDDIILTLGNQGDSFLLATARVELKIQHCRNTVTFWTCAYALFWQRATQDDHINYFLQQLNDFLIAGIAGLQITTIGHSDKSGQITCFCQGIYLYISITTLIISDCEVWIDALLGDHREVKMVPFNRLVRIRSTESLNYLRDGKKETHQK